MDKTIHSAAHKRLLVLLRKCREEAGMTQVELAEAVDETQSWISKVERGERRLDLVELQALCDAMGVGLVGFVGHFVSRAHR